MKLFRKIRDIWRRMTYMQASFALLVPEVLLLLYLFIKAVVTGGGLSLGEGALGLLVLILSGLGMYIPVYGHFVVKADGKRSWKIPFFLHAGIFVLSVILYLSGLG